MNAPIAATTRGTRSAALVLELHDVYSEPTLFDVRVAWGTLPKGAALFAAILDSPPASSERDKSGTMTLATHGDELRLLLEEHRGEPIGAERLRFYELKPDERGISTLPSLLLEPKRPALLAVKVITEVSADAAPPRFDLVQTAGHRVVGGFTVVIAAEPPEGDHTPGQDRPS